MVVVPRLRNPGVGFLNLGVDHGVYSPGSHMGGGMSLFFEFNGSAVVLLGVILPMNQVLPLRNVYWRVYRRAYSMVF